MVDGGLHPRRVRERRNEDARVGQSVEIAEIENVDHVKDHVHASDDTHRIVESARTRPREDGDGSVDYLNRTIHVGVKVLHPLKHAVRLGVPAFVHDRAIVMVYGHRFAERVDGRVPCKRSSSGVDGELQRSLEASYGRGRDGVGTEVVRDFERLINGRDGCHGVVYERARGVEISARMHPGRLDGVHFKDDGVRHSRGRRDVHRPRCYRNRVVDRDAIEGGCHVDDRSLDVAVTGAGSERARALAQQRLFQARAYDECARKGAPSYYRQVRLAAQRGRRQRRAECDVLGVHRDVYDQATYGYIVQLTVGRHIEVRGLHQALTTQR